jgi:hypothetical protein
MMVVCLANLVDGALEHGLEDGVEVHGIAGVGHQLAHVVDDDGALALRQGLQVLTKKGRG